MASEKIFYGVTGPTTVQHVFLLLLHECDTYRLCLSKRKKLENCGPDAPISRNEPSATASPGFLLVQKITESERCVMHAASGSDHAHSCTVASTPVHLRAFIATADPEAPHTFDPP